MAQIDNFLAYMIANRGSDLHLSADEVARMRVDGDLVVMQDAPLPAETIESIIFEILSEPQQEKLIKEKNLDLSYQVNEELGNFRFNVFYTRRGIAVVARAIPSKIPTIEQLGLPDIVANLTQAHKGLILVTGPTGSGKSTTLAAMINHINATEAGHILTVEDPVEFIHPSKMSLVNQRQIGQSCHSFADALKYALREDPDVILVGEMRDLETIALAMTAAETGHLVFGTLHTRGAASSIDRILDSFPSSQQAMVRVMLSESLVAVISQALLKKADGKGRVAAYEIMVVNPAISNLIREGKSFQITSAIQTGRREGMILMEQHIRELMNSGMVSEEEGQNYLDELTGSQPSSQPNSGAAKPKPAAQSVPKAPSKPAPKRVQDPNQNFTPSLMSEHTAIGQVPGLASLGKAKKTLPMNPPLKGAPEPRPATRSAPKPAPKPAPVVEAPPADDESLSDLGELAEVSSMDVLQDFSEGTHVPEAQIAPPPVRTRAPSPSVSPSVPRPAAPRPSPAPAPSMKKGGTPAPAARAAPPPLASKPAAPPLAKPAGIVPTFKPSFPKRDGSEPKRPAPAPIEDMEPGPPSEVDSALSVLPQSTDGRELKSSLLDLTEGEEGFESFPPKKKAG